MVRHTFRSKALQRACSPLIVWILLVFTAAGSLSAQEPTPDPSISSEPAVEESSTPQAPSDPLNRGTPRGTMEGFISAANADDYELAARFLDLRYLSPAEHNQGPELARKLKTVLDSQVWVDFAELSSQAEGFPEDGLMPWQDRIAELRSPEGRVPFVLERVPRTGDHVRIWKIASSTVAHADTLYDNLGPIWLKKWLPQSFFERSILQVYLWQWLGIVSVGLVSWLVALLSAGVLVRLLGRSFVRRHSELAPQVVDLVRGPVRLAAMVIVFGLGRRYFALHASVDEFLRISGHLLIVVAAAWLIVRLIDLAVLGVRLQAEMRAATGLLPVVQPIRVLCKVIVVIAAGLGILGTLGVNVSAAVAGLGIGGLAVALAAQKTLENLIGGIALFADRPVRVGDYFRSGSYEGTVEEIGLRSTRIRTRDRTVISIPNGEFSNLPLENYAPRDHRLLSATIGLRYESSPDQLRSLLADLRRLFTSHPHVLEDKLRIRFVNFGDYSLDLSIFAYIDTPVLDEFLAIREEIYLLIMDAVKEAGTDFAFPSSTVYLGKDDGLPPESVPIDPK